VRGKQGGRNDYPSRREKLHAIDERTGAPAARVKEKAQSMNELPFYKMTGCGNDFIVVDNRAGRVAAQDMPWLARKICRRKMSVGADGLILVETSTRADFKWRFYNSDGSEAEMCGNGGRCAARFAFLEGIAGKTLAFETLAGIVHAEVLGDRVKLRMPGASDLRQGVRLEVDGKTVAVDCINTGVPHAVIRVEDIDRAQVVPLGRPLRHHGAFQPLGTNLNFVQRTTDQRIAVRTYERGVEDETLACGTGCIASALVLAAAGEVRSPVDVLTRGGEVLTIHFRQEGPVFTDICLEGGAWCVSRGALCEGALR